MSLSEKNDFTALDEAGMKGHEIAWQIGHQPVTIHVVWQRLKVGGVSKRKQVLERPNLLSNFVQL